MLDAQYDVQIIHVQADIYCVLAFRNDENSNQIFIPFISVSGLVSFSSEMYSKGFQCFDWKLSHCCVGSDCCHIAVLVLISAVTLCCYHGWFHIAMLVMNYIHYLADWSKTDQQLRSVSWEWHSILNWVGLVSKILWKLLLKIRKTQKMSSLTGKDLNFLSFRNTPQQNVSVGGFFFYLYWKTTKESSFLTLHLYKNYTDDQKLRNNTQNL